MSHTNYGKDFEALIKDAMLKVPGVDVQRLYDTTNGFTGIKQPADFIVYRYPNQYYIECKCTWDNVFHKSKITQLDSLVKKSCTKGIIAGVMIWFISHDYTAFIPAWDLSDHFVDHKSINISERLSGELSHLQIPGRKKRVFFDYDMESFFTTFYH